jgi:stage V sporulation protein G
MSDAVRGTEEQRSQKLDMSVKVYPAQDSKNLLATAAVTLGGCFTIRGLRILDSEKGAFVSMPQRKTAQGEYKDICFPTTAEMRKELNSAVLGEYQRTMEQSYSRAEKAMEKRESVLDTLSLKAADVKSPAPGKPKVADRGDR